MSHKDLDTMMKRNNNKKDKASPGGIMLRNPATMQETKRCSTGGQEDPWRRKLQTLSSTSLPENPMKEIGGL